MPASRLRVLPHSFYERPVLDVARDLIGCRLIHRTPEGPIGGRIVEVEAYGGPGDPGSHADRAPNGRARVMFGPPGVAYVYFTYGMHFCMNAVTGPKGEASAVLLRALEPETGIDLMRAAGGPPTLPEWKLASGPGRLCRALHIGRDLNQADLTTSALQIVVRDEPAPEIHQGTRIGLTLDDSRPWRLWTPSRSVSR